MRDRLHRDRAKPEDARKLLFAAAADEAPKAPRSRFTPCEFCGQSYDRLDPILAAYHSTPDHKPTPDPA